MLLSNALLCLVTPDSATSWTVMCQAPLFMGILQARILEWVAYPFSRDLPTQELQTSALQTDSLPSELPGKPT